MTSSGYFFTVVPCLLSRAKQQNIIVANDGVDKNIIILTPPMCFTCDNARHVIQVLDKALTEIERGTCPELFDSQPGEEVITTELTIPLDVLNGTSMDRYDSDDEPDFKRARYEDMD